MEAGRRKRTLLTLPIIPHALLALLCLPVLLPGCAARWEGQAVRAPDQPPSEAARLVQSGKAAIASGDTVRAEQYLTLAVARGADERATLKDLLAACISGSRLRGALDHALPYLQKHPEEDDLRFLVASLYDSLGQREEAWGQLERLLNHNPRHPDAHYLAGILASERDPEGARDHFRQYLELRPNGAHAPEVRGRLSDLLLGAAPRPTPKDAHAWVDVSSPEVQP